MYGFLFYSRHRDQKKNPNQDGVCGCLGPAAPEKGFWVRTTEPGARPLSHEGISWACREKAQEQILSQSLWLEVSVSALVSASLFLGALGTFLCFVFSGHRSGAVRDL